VIEGDVSRRFNFDSNYGLILMLHKSNGLADVFIGIGECLHLLNALTAYKHGELGLISSSNAFRKVYSAL
jgi:hypothetical protein|tara:strand:+ start:65 stop:274 length:210 start_codon:yes stop_codon:yes gene_type:complete